MPKKKSVSKKEKYTTAIPTTEAVDVDENSVTDENNAADRRPFLERMYGDKAKWLIPVVLIFGCIMIYYQTKAFQYINFDDNIYVYNNPFVTSGLSWKNIRWAFLAFDATNWHPLTWISHQLDVTLFGVNPGPHHLVNVLFHTINSVLLFFTVRLLTGSTWRSGIVAAIFAFHPGHVESVVWVSERKDVLSTLFFLLTICAYAKYSRNRSIGMYAITLLMLALGLLVKPMLVTLPCVLLLLDFWPLGSIGKLDLKTLLPLVGEKISMFAMIVVSSFLTFAAQKSGGAVMSIEALPISYRVMNALVSYIRYLKIFVYPANLAGWYPFPESYPGWQVAGAAAILLAITIFVLKDMRARPYLATGWFWYLGCLVPVIGLVQVGAQSHADRYTYIPFIGLSIAVVWLLAEIVKKRNINLDAISAVTVALVVVLAILGFRQVLFWQTTESFYQHTLAITERNYIFEHNYCNYLLKLGRLDEAETQCRNSISSNPNYPNSYVSLGVVMVQQGRQDEALKAFETASLIAPDDVQAYANWVNALISLKKYDQAYAGIEKLENWPGDPEEANDRLHKIYKMIGFGLGQDGNQQKAILYLKKAINLNPLEPDVHSNLATLLYEQGKHDEAFGEIRISLGLNPNQADIQNAAGRILLLQGKKAESIEYFRKALELDPNSVNAAKNLKIAQSPDEKAK